MVRPSQLVEPSTANMGKFKRLLEHRSLAPRAAGRSRDCRDGRAGDHAPRGKLPCSASGLVHRAAGRQQHLSERRHRLVAVGSQVGQLAVAGRRRGLVLRSPDAARRLAIGCHHLRVVDPANHSAVSGQNRSHRLAGHVVERQPGGGGRGPVTGIMVRAAPGALRTGRIGSTREIGEWIVN